MKKGESINVDSPLRSGIKIKYPRKIWPLIFTETLQIAPHAEIKKTGPNDPAFWFSQFRLILTLM